MDETGLFWKFSSDGTLATQQTIGGKSEKARITVNFCCNVTGSRKMQPWFIENAENPRCFDRFDVYIENFVIMWRNNKKA